LEEAQVVAVTVLLVEAFAGGKTPLLVAVAVAATY
jgi:hypothetical protein